MHTPESIERHEEKKSGNAQIKFKRRLVSDNQGQLHPQLSQTIAVYYRQSSFLI